MLLQFATKNTVAGTYHKIKSKIIDFIRIIRTCIMKFHDIIFLTQLRMLQTSCYNGERSIERLAVRTNEFHLNSETMKDS